MKNKKINTIPTILLILILLIIVIKPIMADNENFDDELEINIVSIDYKNTSEGDSIMTLNISIISHEDSFNNKNFIFDIFTDSYNESKEFSFTTDKFPYRVGFVNVTNPDTSKFEQCLVDKGSLNRGYDICAKDLDECKNHSNYKTDYETCILNVKENELDMQSKNNKIESLNKEKTDTKNVKWFWAIGGAILGFVGLLLKQGKIGMNPKDASEHEFNRNQAG